MAHSPVHTEFMSATGDRPATRRAPDTTSYPVSRENGDIMPDTKQNPTMSAKESPFAKSWVHFVAGGYVLNLSLPPCLSSETDISFLLLSLVSEA